MRYSFVAMISDNANTKVGSIFAGYEHFMNGNLLMVTIMQNAFWSFRNDINGLYKHETILNIIENYVYVLKAWW